MHFFPDSGRFACGRITRGPGARGHQARCSFGAMIDNHRASGDEVSASARSNYAVGLWRTHGAWVVATQQREA